MAEEKKILSIHREEYKPVISEAEEFMTANEKIYVPQLARGLGVLLRRFFKNLLSSPENDELITIAYPEVRREYPKAFRGVHRLTRREDGSPKCVACYMCATACPSQCIYIVAENHEDTSIEKAPAAFYIDELRCIFCGFCEEACPKDAIRLDTGLHPPVCPTRDPMLFGKERMIGLRGAEEPDE